MLPDEAPASQYRGIKRVQRACLNCRRKKAKCSGEQPVCGYCKRLSQECQWDIGPSMISASEGQSRSPRSESEPRSPIHDEALVTRVAAIESKMDNLVSTLHAYLPALVNQRAENPPSPSITAPLTGVGNPTLATPGSTSTVSDGESKLIELPPALVLIALINVYFARVHNQPYSFFHEQNFRQRLAEGLLPDYLIFAVLASALRFSDDPYFNGIRHETTTRYASEAWKQIVSVWVSPESDPDVPICQAITLLSIIDFTAGRRHPGWLKIGLSIRIAQDLCLMMEPDSELGLVEQEERRRVFWSVYVLDKLCSCGRARPAALADSHCRVQLPCDEASFRDGAQSSTSTLGHIFSMTGSGHHLSTLSSFALVVLTASIIGRCAQHSIHEHSRGESRLPPWDSKSEFARIYSVLLQLETRFEMGTSISEVLRRDCVRHGQIEMQLAGPVIFSRAMFHTCLCILHHPFLLFRQSELRGVHAPPSFLNRAFQTCRENACLMSDLLREIKAQGCSAHFSFMGYCATVAGGVHTLYLNDDESTVRLQSVDHLKAVMSFLEEFSCYWKNGKCMTTILQSLAQNSPTSKLLVAASPKMENISSELLEKLWASVDYTTMSQSLTNVSPTSFNATTPSMSNPLGFEVSESANVGFNCHSNSSLTYASGFSPYSGLLLKGMSPIESFFGSESMNLDGSMNFGG